MSKNSLVQIIFSAKIDSNAVAVTICITSSMEPKTPYAVCNVPDEVPRIANIKQIVKMWFTLFGTSWLFFREWIILIIVSKAVVTIIYPERNMKGRLNSAKL